MKRIVLVGCSLLILACLVLAYGWVKGDFRGLLFVSKKNTCPTLQSPVNISHVTSVLYPGQERGGDYKAHGGFRLAGLSNNNITVKAPISAKLTKAGHYIEIGEVQYIFIFETNCGLTYRFDHLLTLAPKFQAVSDKLPLAKEGRSEFVSVGSDIEVEVGETIATAVGFRHNDQGKPNVSFDFGVYLDRYDHGLCWLDLLPIDDATRLKALPGGDYQSGKTSDYCH